MPRSYEIGTTVKRKDGVYVELAETMPFRGKILTYRRTPDGGSVYSLERVADLHLPPDTSAFWSTAARLVADIAELALHPIKTYRSIQRIRRKEQGRAK